MTRRPHIARAILTAQGRPATYTAPGGPAVSCRARIREMDARVRFNRTAEMTQAQVLGDVSADLGVVAGGIIGQAGARYIVEDWDHSSVPGLVELVLTRIEGAAVEVRDLSRAVLAGYRAEPVEFLVDGEWITLQGHVRRQVVETDVSGGVEFTTLLQLVALRRSEQEAAGIDVGTLSRLDGIERPVASLMADGLGMVRLVL